MSKQNTNKITFLAATVLAISAGFGYVRIPFDKVYGERKGARKSSGGKPAIRINSPRYKAWKKLFGGIACPTYQHLE